MPPLGTGEKEREREAQADIIYPRKRSRNTWEIIFSFFVRRTAGRKEGKCSGREAASLDRTKAGSASFSWRELQLNFFEFWCLPLELITSYSNWGFAPRSLTGRTSFWSALVNYVPYTLSSAKVGLVFISAGLGKSVNRCMEDRIDQKWGRLSYLFCNYGIKSTKNSCFYVAAWLTAEKKGGESQTKKANLVINRVSERASGRCEHSANRLMDFPWSRTTLRILV